MSTGATIASQKPKEMPREGLNTEGNLERNTISSQALAKAVAAVELGNAVGHSEILAASQYVAH